MILPALAAVGVAWTAGGAVVALGWHRDAPLPPLAWIGLAGLVGPCVTGTLLLVAGVLGLRPNISIPLVSMLAMGGFAWGIRRRRPSPTAPAMPGRLVLVLVLVAAVGWTCWVASRTHLGWDGTVVWYQKARIIAASDGVMPASAAADLTRSWTAPDYPLHVPLAMAWVRLWQPVEDERAMKVLPAAWGAAILLLVAAAVLERSGSASRAAWAVVLLAAAPRLWIGEGSYTSGYADGPLAGLLAALVWVAWRRDESSHAATLWLVGVLAAALAWTKQEGVVASVVAAAVCAWWGHGRMALAIAGPAIAVAGAWHAWILTVGGVTGMAYEWRGIGEAARRIGPIGTAYATTLSDVRTWGLLWPGLAAAVLLHPHSRLRLPLTIVLGTAGAGALAFVWSDWPDVREHLAVTVPRLAAGLAPSLVLIATAGKGLDSVALSRRQR